MTNLIPPGAKKQLVRLYWLRLISAWAILWSIALMAGALLLWPTHMLITGTIAAYTDTADSVSERTEAYDAMIAELEKSNQEAKQIVRAKEQPALSQLLQDVWSVTGQGVSVASVQLTRDDRGIAPIGLTGDAQDRQSLASFRDRIATLPYVEQVDLPIENLAQNQDIDFTISVTVNSDNL